MFSFIAGEQLFNTEDGSCMDVPGLLLQALSLDGLVKIMLMLKIFTVSQLYKRLMQNGIQSTRNKKS